MSKPIPIAVAHGDGIGPDIMAAVLRILDAAGAELAPTQVEMGKRVYERGLTSGITPETREVVESLGVLLKAPLETPKGRGAKSVNVTARKLWSAYANKRVFRTLRGVDTVHSRAGIPIDLTIVRENIEDTYGGIEHMLTHDVALCRRFITRPGSLQVHRYAFEMARRKGARKITCAHKANIMKLTDGLFLECFHAVARDYPELRAEDVIVDDLAMKLVTRPDQFDVIVLPNLQGDIISDLCAGLVGGLGFAPSANIGAHVCIFEAVHGTAPDIAGRGIANPTALLLSALMMLRHLGRVDTASRIDIALERTLADGCRTVDFGDPRTPALSTEQYADAIIERLPRAWEDTATPHAAIDLWSPAKPTAPLMMQTTKTAAEAFGGVDLFVESDLAPEDLAQQVTGSLPPGATLTMVSNRGTQVWPNGSPFTECVAQYRLRIEHPGASQDALLDIAARVGRAARLCSVEMLLQLDGRPAYSLAQGQ